jgi:hypothetical protein
MRNALALVCAALCLPALSVRAESTDSTWTFTKGVDYENPKGALATPPSTTLSLSGDTLRISATCSVHLGKKNYYPGGPFQMLLKSGDSEADIARFMKSSLGFDLKGDKTYYEADPSDCNKLGTEFLASANQLVAIRGADFFYAFARQGGNTAAASDSHAVPAASGPTLKVTTLPFSMSDYSGNCAPAMVKGVPTPSARCSPAYYYHVATRNSSDALSKLVGSHDYQKGGAESADDDYNNPVSHGLHPVFLVFPPMGDVTVVRVDDFEGHQEQREQISGAFLTIKDGKVTDELNTGCDLDARFVCTDHDGRKYKLTPDGKFQQVK